MTTAPLATATRVRTRRVADTGALLDHLPADHPVAWWRGGEGLVGWGVAARVEVSGPDRFAAAAAWWDQIVRRCDVDDDVELPGSGPVAFASFAFADRPGHSTLVLPRVVLGRRDDVAWVTTVDEAGPVAASTPPRRPRGVRWSEAAQPVTAWRSAVQEAINRIQAGELAKVVLAYDLVATADDPVDPRWLLHRLAERYRDCWVFAVDGLVGATPELLVRRQGDAVQSRVLAGTVRRTGDAEADRAAAAALRCSAKDLAEHAYAVRSLVDALTPHCASVDASAAVDVLELRNVLHLSTDVRAVLADGSGLLELAAALHPTAAVGGTPTDRALALIDRLERMDRGRYAGPVGWVDARGDGELGIALRCAEVAGRCVRLFAGCGIVAGSDPDAEVAEAAAKFLPVRDALEP